MNKKAIWAIIGLMGAAVIGVVWLQMDLIRTSMKVNEERFDKNVYNAMQTVVYRLEKEEEKEIFNYSINGYITSYIQRGSTRGVSGLKMDYSGGGNMQSGNYKTFGGRMLDQLMDEMVAEACMCSKCMEERDQKIRRLVFNNSRETRELEERIKLDYLDDAIRLELSNRGVDADYKYAVYSNIRKDYVIKDGYYVVQEEHPKGAIAASAVGGNYEYEVNLFPGDSPPPGLLMIHFPAKTSYVWRSLWLNFLGSILFTAIILFCFAYTINVIFRQKKLGEMKGDFINNMTHEFKTPIATISLAADSITSPMISGSPDKVRRFAGIIKQENKRMNNQVEKVLQMALIDKKEFNLKVTDINLHDVISNAVENISLQVEKKDGQVEGLLEADNPMVQGDSTHVSNIINNLLDNANKYSPENPEISVSTRNVANGVEVIVKDKGIGMSKEARKHIFDKFYRVHTGNLHDVKGFGLGLSYVKAMMTAHKGQIDVKSELGKGSSFILFFPFRVE